MIKLALPAGDARPALAQLLAAAGLLVEGYAEGSRSYRLPLSGHEQVKVRVFRERDIPIQVALGNYDLGICNIAWIDEMRARWPGQPVVPLADLGIEPGSLFAATAASWSSDGLAALGAVPLVRLASEYPNLTEAFACALRLPRYRVQPVWGAAEAYPPEDADCVLVCMRDEEAVHAGGLRPVFHLRGTSLWLIANEGALAGKDLGVVLGPLLRVGATGKAVDGVRLPAPVPATTTVAPTPRRTSLRMAVPDGHQKPHVVEALAQAGITFAGYD
ncbi:MAG: ATP phosphoribosyltransferase, partial [Burkholderiales bacterium]